MAFPTTPSNGQIAVVNNITYQYVSADDTWVRIPSLANLITVNNFTVVSNLNSGNVLASAYFWANGTPFVSSTYGNTQVAAYLTGNVTTGNVSATGYYFANGTPFTSSNFGNADIAAYLPTYTGNITAGNVTVTGNIVGGGVRTTTGTTAPINPVPGDVWFDSGANLLFRYTDLGTSRRWLDITGSTGFATTYNDTNVSSYLAGSITVGNVTTTGQITGNLTPSANVTYSLGEDGLRWKNLYLGGQTIFLGNSTITEDVSLGTVTIIPPPTAAVPNPVAVVISPYGTISTANTSGGQITGNVNVSNSTTLSNITVTGNVTTASIYTDHYYYSNGSPFVSSTYGNTQVAAYIAGNTTIGNVTATGYYFANGAPFVSSTYGNTQVAAYIAGNTTIGNVTATGYYWANGAPFVSGSTASTTPRFVTYILSGAISGARTGNIRYYPPVSMTISNVVASVSTVVSGTNLVFEIYKNGTSLGPTYTINTASYRMNTTSASFSLNTTDYLTISINSGTSSDLRIDLQYS